MTADSTVASFLRRNKPALFIAALCSLFAGSAAAVLAAQESHLRRPNPAESAVISHYREVMHQVLDKFQSDDFDQNVDYDVSDDVFIANDPDVPLDINEMMQRTYTVKPGSKLFDAQFAPVIQKLNGTHDPNELAAISKQMKINRYSVEVHFNALSARVKPPPGANPDLRIPGAALAYRVGNYKFDKGTSVVLLFGDWKSATWRPSDNTYRFKFKHAAHQPFIENVAIQLDGLAEGIDPLLRNINWQRVNDVLSP